MGDRLAKDSSTGKGLTGLNQHQIRTWTSWHRWATVALLVHAFLTITAALEHPQGPAPVDQIPVTLYEIGHLFAAVLLHPFGALDQRLHWSAWRRRHQHRARTSPYRQQASQHDEDHELRLEY